MSLEITSHDGLAEPAAAVQPSFDYLTEPDSARRLAILAREQAELEERRAALAELMHKAGEEQDKKARAQLIDQYDGPVETITGTFTEPLRDAKGNTPEKHAVKVIRDKEHLQRMQEENAVIQKYFPEAEFKEMDFTDGRKVMVAMNVSARECNAVLRAERDKERMAEQAKQMQEAKEQAQGMLMSSGKDAPAEAVLDPAAILERVKAMKQAQPLERPEMDGPTATPTRTNPRSAEMVR